MQTITLHSTVPESLGEFHVHNKEYCQYLYLPIKMADGFDIVLEPRLKFLENMIYAAIDHECYHKSLDWITGKYIYLTVKQTLVPKGLDQNRPGWHSDGFGTNDVQFIWFNKWPTEFLIGDYEVSKDDIMSMEEMKCHEDGYYLHGRQPPLYEPPPFHLYRIDQNNIHRTVPAPETGVRLFVKITISEHRYAQEGNSHNYNMNYDWTMAPRKTDRNQPHQTT